MSHRANSIVQAWMETPTRGIVQLARDWKARYAPPVRFSNGLKTGDLERVPERVYADLSGYTVSDDVLQFILPAGAHPRPFARRSPVYVAGDFNSWDAIGKPAWQLTEEQRDGDTVLVWQGPAEPLLSHPPHRFKFVTGEGQWFDVPGDAPNLVVDDDGNRNRIVDPDRTGHHLFAFELERPLDLTQSWQVSWSGGTEGDISVPLRPGAYFYTWASDLPLGAIVGSGETIFRLFAPRAQRVEVLIAEGTAAKPERFRLARRSDADGAAGVWEATIGRDLHGWHYWYQVQGPQDEFGLFDPHQRILDPYALAAVGRAGPGVVVDRRRIRRRPDGFKTPAWQDLVICEAHVRDLVAHAPIVATEAERRGFGGLRKWIDSDPFYLSQLGVNCVELQPVQEFDNETVEEYHWGYMTNNYFAPESSYALEPAKASGIRELQEVVAAFHRRGIAVILDVVYNHVGVPGHLMFIDKLYYFEVDGQGGLSNWSGCGNDLRARSAMATRLIIDSCLHLMETYGVDGFRFDLAELLGGDVLRQIELALKRAKPDVVLIAEPWSFRGHIAGALGETGWASWNDGYRRFAKEWVRGHGTRETFEYYLKGSPWYFAHWPAQTVNYVESHDDRTWVDEVTENADGSGFLPTPNDRRRAHLMAALLFSSIGIPMLSAGQDFLRSKHGVNNTYQRGDLNALYYRRLQRYAGTHAYFADWIAFRRSETGRLLRHYSRATETFFRFWFATDSLAGAVLFNADNSAGPEQILLALNPTGDDVEIDLDPAVASRNWRLVADHERFVSNVRPAAGGPLELRLWVPGLGCGLWVRHD